MKCISLLDPWAQLVALSKKKIETRGWKTYHRGLLAIHASKAMRKEDRELCRDPRFATALGWPEKPEDVFMSDWEKEEDARISALSRGCVVATCKLLACVPTMEFISSSVYSGDCTEQELLFGNYAPGRYAWILSDIKPLPKPIPAKGALSLWDWNPDSDSAL